jgi:hypothetical protein
VGDTHLNELRLALEDRGWRVSSEREGDGYKISRAWQIQRSTKAAVTELLFDGQDDLQVLPIERAYACHVAGRKNLSIYFGSMKEFRKALPTFMSGLDSLEDEKKSV